MDAEMMTTDRPRLLPSPWVDIRSHAGLYVATVNRDDLQQYPLEYRDSDDEMMYGIWRRVQAMLPSAYVPAIWTITSGWADSCGHSARVPVPWGERLQGSPDVAFEHIFHSRRRNGALSLRGILSHQSQWMRDVMHLLLNEHAPHVDLQAQDMFWLESGGVRFAEVYRYGEDLLAALLPTPSLGIAGPVEAVYGMTSTHEWEQWSGPLIEKLTAWQQHANARLERFGCGLQAMYAQDAIRG